MVSEEDVRRDLRGRVPWSAAIDLGRCGRIGIASSADTVAEARAAAIHWHRTFNDAGGFVRDCGGACEISIGWENGLV